MDAGIRDVPIRVVSDQAIGLNQYHRAGEAFRQICLSAPAQPSHPADIELLLWSAIRLTYIPLNRSLNPQ